MDVSAFSPCRRRAASGHSRPATPLLGLPAPLNCGALPGKPRPAAPRALSHAAAQLPGEASTLPPRGEPREGRASGPRASPGPRAEPHPPRLVGWALTSARPQPDSAIGSSQPPHFPENDTKGPENPKDLSEATSEGKPDLLTPRQVLPLHPRTFPGSNLPLGLGPAPPTPPAPPIPPQPRPPRFFPPPPLPPRSLRGN